MWVRSKTLQKLVLKAYNHRSANRKCLELISGNFMAALHVLWNFSKFGMVCGLKWSESSKSEQVITVSTKIRDTNGNGNGKSHQVAQMLHKKPRLSAEKLLEIMLAYPPPAILLQKQSWAPNYFVLKVFRLIQLFSLNLIAEKNCGEKKRDTLKTQAGHYGTSKKKYHSRGVDSQVSVGVVVVHLHLSGLQHRNYTYSSSWKAVIPAELQSQQVKLIKFNQVITHHSRSFLVTVTDREVWTNVMLAN